MTAIWERWVLLLRWYLANEWMHGRGGRLPVDRIDHKFAVFFTVIFLLILLVIGSCSVEAVTS